MLAEIYSPHSRAVDVLRLGNKNCWKSVTVKSDVLNIILFYHILRFISLYVMIYDKIK